MSNYTENEKSCRVDFWKPNGKWYTTEAVVWTAKYTATDIHEAFKKSLIKHFGGKPRLVGMTATCLHPFSLYAHPVSLVVERDWFKERR